MADKQRARMRLWIHALESGKYHRLTGALCEVRGNQTFHCCLGVACRVAIKEGAPLKSRRDNQFVSFTDPVGYHRAYLGPYMRQYFGLPLDIAHILVNMNDRGQSFREIAKYLRTTFAIDD